MVYLMIILLFYGVYKMIQTSFEVKKISLSPINIIFIFLWHLLLLCLFYFGVIGMSPFLWAVLFLKILLFLAITSLFWLFIYSLWYTLLQRISLFKWDDKDKYFVFLSSIWVGFFIFMLGVFLLSVVGAYQKIPLLLFVWMIAFVWYKHTIEILRISKTKKVVTYSLKDSSSGLALFVDEIHFIVITLLIGVNFISTFRPFPIGWDDLGAYMNYPKLIAQAGELIPFWQMQTWQLYTWIGHVFWNQTYAFFLNSFSWMLVAVVAYVALRGLIKKEEQSFNIPLFCVMILLMMPMTVFQLAKDMKLDYALLAMSIAPLYIMYHVMFSENKLSQRNSWLSFGIIGLLIW